MRVRKLSRIQMYSRLQSATPVSAGFSEMHFYRYGIQKRNWSRLTGEKSPLKMSAW